MHFSVFVVKCVIKNTFNELNIIDFDWKPVHKMSIPFELWNNDKTKNASALNIYERVRVQNLIN